MLDPRNPANQGSRSQECLTIDQVEIIEAVGRKRNKLRPGDNDGRSAQLLCLLHRIDARQFEHDPALVQPSVLKLPLDDQAGREAKPDIFEIIEPIWKVGLEIRNHLTAAPVVGQ